MNSNIELKLVLNDEQDDRLKEVITDGYHSSCMLDNLIPSRGNDTALHILNNAKTALSFFANPKLPKSTSKILCLGKVQSGKTAFFIASIAYAFDNG